MVAIQISTRRRSRATCQEDHGIETVGGAQKALEDIDGLRHLEDLSTSEQATLAARRRVRTRVRRGRSLASWTTERLLMTSRVVQLRDREPIGIDGANRVVRGLH